VGVFDAGFQQGNLLFFTKLQNALGELSAYHPDFRARIQETLGFAKTLRAAAHYHNGFSVEFKVYEQFFAVPPSETLRL
jgi:hypothetical protein